MTAPTPARADGPAQRQLHLDLLKLIGSQLIVLHHLSAYGPVAEAASQWAPGLMRWLYDYARMAVQVFLVLGGYLALHSLQPALLSGRTPLAVLLLRRYVRLAAPFMAAMGLAVVAAAAARLWLSDDFIPAAPSLGQLLAHALLLHGVLGTDALSAGVWYVAIDFQLYALLVALLWAVRRFGHHLPGDQATRRLARLMVVLLVMASLYGFNRDADWDTWALYFFGAYGLGALAWWTSDPDDQGRGLQLWWMVAALAAAALVVDWRTRIAVALVVALTLVWSRRSGWLHTWPQHPAVTYLSRISYSVFLLNFPVALVVNAWFTRHVPAVQSLGVLLAWLACNLLGAAFHHAVEARLGRLGRRRPAAA